LISGSEGTLVVLAKAPQIGRVKTRLTPPFTAAQAAAFYTAMLSDVLAASAGFAESLDLAAIVAVHPGEQCAAVGFEVVDAVGFDEAAQALGDVKKYFCHGYPPIR